MEEMALFQGYSNQKKSKENDFQSFTKKSRTDIRFVVKMVNTMRIERSSDSKADAPTVTLSQTNQ